MRAEISEEVWSAIEPLPPPVQGRGRPWSDHRVAVGAMIWKYRTGSPWRDVRARFGRWNSIDKQFMRWSGDGTWAAMLTEVHKRSDAAGRLDRVVSVDSTVV